MTPPSAKRWRKRMRNERHHLIMDPINMPLAGATDYADRIAGALQDVAPSAQILIAGRLHLCISKHQERQ